MSQCPMGFKISPVLQEHMCRLGTKLTFEEASEELTRLLGVEVNAKQIERICHCYGEQIEQIDWKEVYSDCAQLKFPKGKQDPVYVMADGSMILTRDEKWKEVKLGRVFSSSAHIKGVSKDRSMVSESVYSAHLGNAEEFWERFSKEIPSARDLVFICDGAKWLWNYIGDCYPESTQILDFYHCKEHICHFANEYFGKDDISKESFITSLTQCLFDKRVDTVFSTIEKMKTSTLHKQKEKEKLLNYLYTHKARINYGEYIERGLLIGSGPIEAAHRNVIQKRMKLSGQRWTTKGAQQVLNLRVYEQSKKWDTVLGLITNFKAA
jgi:hypothetical protein